MHKCIKQNMPTICFLLGLTPELTAYCFLEPCQFCPPSAYCPVTARRRVTRHYQPSQRGPTKSGLPSGGLPLCGLTLAESFSSPPNRLLIPEPVAPRTFVGWSSWMETTGPSPYAEPKKLASIDWKLAMAVMAVMVGTVGGK